MLAIVVAYRNHIWERWPGCFSPLESQMVPYCRIFLSDDHEAYIKHHIVMKVYSGLTRTLATHKNYTFIKCQQYMTKY